MVFEIEPLSNGGRISRSRDDPVRFADQMASVDYRDALEHFQELSKAEWRTGPLLDVCRSKLLTHGQRTEHVLILFHGYTNCPEQFARLGERFHALGHNVLIPRLPHHGYADRMTGDIANLTKEDLMVYGDQAVDIARGLGREVTVMGFSAGGVVAAWLAQNRSDVACAVPIAPSLGVSFVPPFLIGPLTGALLTIPNFYIWWDPRTREKSPLCVYHAYPRYASHSLAHIFRLGLALKARTRRSGPPCRNILVVTNAAEPAVHNGMIEQLVKAWRQDGHRVNTYSFEKAMNLPHDLITPGTPGVPTEDIYARLIEQVQALHTNKALGQKSDDKR